jgi:two-component system response regulator HydG
VIPKILILEDDIAFAQMLQNFLTKKGFEVLTTHSLKVGKETLIRYTPDLLLLDYRLPDGTGIDMIDHLKSIRASIPTIIMTSFNDIRTAIKAMRKGAFDYITKPVNPDEMLMIIHEALSKSKTLDEPVQFKFLTGNSAAAQHIQEHIALVAPTDMSVIIQGESGTGKEFVARNIHALSKRSKKPFVAIDCGALSNDLAAGELFGYTKGAFTGAIQSKKGQFEFANGGTLFLDEIGNLNYETQVKLLRALQEKVIQPIGSNHLVKVDIRIIAATNDDLQKSIKTNAFREDLYHRLNEFSIRTLTLRQRIEDLPVFINHFIHIANEELDRNVLSLSPGVMDVFSQYEWPGNLRELKNVIKRAVLLTKGSVIDFSVLPDEMATKITTPMAASLIGSDLKAVQEMNERELIEKTLREVKYNKTKAAQLLNIDRKTLYNKLQKYNLDVK